MNHFLLTQACDSYQMIKLCTVSSLTILLYRSPLSYCQYSLVVPFWERGLQTPWSSGVYTAVVFTIYLYQFTPIKESLRKFVIHKFVM